MKKSFWLALLFIALSSYYSPVKAYVVQRGDTLCGIAHKIGISCDELIKENPQIENPNLIYPKQEINEGLIGVNPLPTDNYDTFLTAPLSSSATTVYVNVIPTGLTESIYTLFASDGTTPREKIYCIGTASNPYRLTGCVRGVSFSPSSGVISEIAGTGLSHSKNIRIAITDNINFSGKALAILYGNQKTSSTEFMFGGGYNTTYKFYYHKTSSTSTDPFLYWNGTNLGWSDNAVDTYTFASGGSGLTASSTKAIGITNSKIHVNASSTGGLEFDATTGYLQANQSDSITADLTGLHVATSSPFLWTGLNTWTATTTFATSTMASSTINNINGTNLQGTSINSIVNGELNNKVVSTTFTNIDTPLPVNIDTVIFPTTTIAANTLGTGKMLHSRLAFDTFRLGLGAYSTSTFTILLGSSSSTFVYTNPSSTAMLGATGYLDVSILDAGANAQEINVVLNVYEKSWSNIFVTTLAGTANRAVNNNFVIYDNYNSIDSNQREINVLNSYIEVLR